jgi:NitT/TauT family transport system substrate-binding protein
MFMRTAKYILTALVLIHTIFNVPRLVGAQPVRVGVTGIGIEFTPFYAGKQRNIFKKYGLDVEVISVGGATQVVQILLGGSVDFAIVGGASIRAAAQGADIVWIASYINHIPWALIVKPHIKNVEDIKGRKLGISRFGTASDVSTRLVMERIGLNPDKDITIVQVGGQTERFAALRSGAVDGTVVGPPLSGIADKLGYNVFFKMADLGVAYPHEGIVVTRQYATSRRETILSFLKGFLETVKTMKADKNFAVSSIASHLKLDPVKDRDSLDASYREVVLRDYDGNPRPNVDGVKFMLDFLSKEKGFVLKGSNNPRDYVDSSFMNQLNESGFVDALYK